MPRTVETRPSAPARAPSPFEVAYTAFFVSGILLVALNLIVPGIRSGRGFLNRNDFVIWGVLFITMLMVVFQLSRIYFVLHHISDEADGDARFVTSLPRPGVDLDRLIKFILALVIISTPKYNFLGVFVSQNQVDVVRAPGFPEVYNVEEVNHVLWDGAGYCFALAVCFYVLILWDINIFGHYCRYPKTNSNDGARGAPDDPSQCSADGFAKFFYIPEHRLHLLTLGAFGYFRSWKFIERLLGLAFSLLMVMSIADWYFLWPLLAVITLIFYGVIITAHRELMVNRVFVIFLKPFYDLMEILSVLPYWMRAKRRSGLLMESAT